MWAVICRHEFWKNAYSFFSYEALKMHWRLLKSTQAHCLKTKFQKKQIHAYL